VLVRLHAASLNALDYRRFEKTSIVGRLTDEVFLRSVGKILGAELAGRVEAVGATATRFRPGDAVFGVSAGLVGAFAEYACAAEDELASKPPSLSFEAAAAAPIAASTALKCLRDSGRIRPGQKVLIHGASGGVGTFAVQIAKYYGAEVTAVCSTRNMDIARSIGADHVIDYTKEDFTQSGQAYDVVLDMVPGKSSFASNKSSLKPNGLYLAGAGGLESFAQMAWTTLTGGKKVIAGMAPHRVEDLVFLKELLETGKLKPVIDRGYPLEQTAEAHRYADTGHKRGSVVITIAKQEGSSHG
jgi:NADPH:quinone reductase-like Zn-dependent oxidoreductase